MNFNEVIRVSLRTLGRNKMRTLLTMLGIIIGVMAVICIVGVGTSASDQVQDQIQSLGVNMLFVMAGSVNSGGVQMGTGATNTLTVNDAHAMLQEIPQITMISPETDTTAQVVYQGQNWATRDQGVGTDYFDIRNWSVVVGSSFSERDIDTAADVCVIGSTVASKLFSGDNPIGKVIRVKTLPVTVIGELATKGQSTFGQDQDDVIMMPYTTVMKKLVGVDWLQLITASVDSKNDVDSVTSQITALLRQRHHLRSDENSDFSIRSPAEIAQTVGRISLILTVLLGSVAAISLLVGGIGIMNIMLVSVTERTREIGVRIAVGATEGDVQRQFLSEAVVLSSIGGLIGVVFGIASSIFVAKAMAWPTAVSPLSIVGAVAFSAGVGIFFGYYPARKASRLDPIEALRYE
ncbi:MAG TPA: ABC transporter permease [Candidatus Acidoferrales bacterium]|nr:ABC transporter permease [Candidatus Acidoferrales bacterium]